jgi:hypothetical protein
MTDTEKQAIQKVLDKFAKRRGRKDWKTYIKGAETLFFCERDIATLAYRAGRESMDTDDFKTYQNHNEKHMLGDNIHPECAFCKCEQVVRDEMIDDCEKCRLIRGDSGNLAHTRIIKKLASQRGDDVK